MILAPGETVVETKSCKSCGISFAITDRDIEFYDRVSPVFAGKKESIPAPTLCPDCRQRRRLAWRNERKLYRRKCDLTGKEIISIYSPDKPYEVYEHTAWWSDEWDAMDYGREFDFSRTFARQYAELARLVPKQALSVDETMESSSYCHYGHACQRAYRCVNCYNLEDSYYCTSCWPSAEGQILSDAVDCDGCQDSRHIYDSLDLKGCHDCFYSRSLEGCIGCYFSRDLRSCRQCLGCVNLVSKQYHVLNREVSPEEFDRIFHELLSDSTARVRFVSEFRALSESLPVLAARNLMSEDVTGENIYASRHVHRSFFVVSAENVKYSYVSGYDTRDMYDAMNAGGSSDGLYEAQHAHGQHCSAFAVDADYGELLYYCELVRSCSSCFACIGLRHKKYCILNKQYTEAEYNELVPKIITHMRRTGEWGEFFSPSLSPFGYNETVAMEYYPLTKEEALKQWFNWSDYEPPFPKVDKVIPANKLPERIEDIPDDILNWAIECEVTRKPYRIIKQELEFYRKHSLPIPRRHPDQRHLDRLSLRNPRKLYERTCDSCSKDIVTTYSPDRPERVYCQECYEREVYG